VGRSFQTLALLVLATSALATAQPDPFYGRVRGLVSGPYPSLRGADCLAIDASPDVVFRILIAPERAAQWLLAAVPDVVPRKARYRRGPTASAGETLTLDVDLVEGPRKIELTVLAVIPGQLVSLRITKDDAGVASGLSSLTHTLYVEKDGNGGSDLWWANHYDPETPFAAVSSLGAAGLKERREAGLRYLKAIAEAAARTPYPPLHDAPRK